MPGGAIREPLSWAAGPKLGQVSGQLISDPPDHVSPIQNKARQPLIKDRTSVTVAGSVGEQEREMRQSRASSHKLPRPDS